MLAKLKNCTLCGHNIKKGGIRNFRLDFIVFKHEQKLKYSSWSSSFKLTYFHLATNENVFAWKAASVRAHQQTLARESPHCDQCLAPPQAALQTAHAISVRILSANLNKISSEENLNVHHTFLPRHERGRPAALQGDSQISPRNGRDQRHLCSYIPTCILVKRKVSCFSACQGSSSREIIIIPECWRSPRDCRRIWPFSLILRTSRCLNTMSPLCLFMPCWVDSLPASVTLQIH